MTTAQLFADNFDTLAASPDGVAKLRELILQLAVQGKLVPQNPNDEPASVLLEKIEKEKAKLTKAGKLKKQKPLPPITDDEIPFDIPSDWEWSRLGNICTVVGGGTPKTSHPEYFSDDGVPWLTPADLYNLKDVYISKGKRDISPLGLQKSSAQLLPEGSVLFSSRAPIGYVAISKNGLATNQGFKSCVPYIKEMNLFIYNFLKASVKSIEANASGTTFKEVSGKVVSVIKIPVPPLAEQKRIVAKVDTLMGLCDQLQGKIDAARTESKKLTASTIHHLLAG